MTSADSPRPASIPIEKRLELLRAADEGRLEGLPCPRCSRASVAAWFTHSPTGEYLTWFTCAACDFEMRAQNSGKPKHYSAARVRAPASHPVA